MSSIPPSQECPQCGAEIPGKVHGLCPRCLLAGAAETTGGDACPAQSAPPDLPALQAAFPQLEIIRLIGRGGMGFVYLARQPQLGRSVALKVLPVGDHQPARFLDRFQREARALARLNHPGIVGVYDFGLAGGFCFLMLEYVEGMNLRQAMATGRLDASAALAIVPRICEALQFAHEQGVLHRDIKPENILLDTHGQPKLADFGIAKLVGEEAVDPRLTVHGSRLGTPSYMAPEQLEAPSAVDHRADIYSVGVVLYELLTGELPLGRFAPPAAKAGLDARIDGIVLQALARERELRQRSVGEVGAQVETVATSPGAPSPASTRSAGCLLAGLSLAAGVTIMVQAFRQPPVNQLFWNRTALATVFLGAGFGGMLSVWSWRRPATGRPTGWPRTVDPGGAALAGLGFALWLASLAVPSPEAGRPLRLLGGILVGEAALLLALRAAGNRRTGPGDGRTLPGGGPSLVRAFVALALACAALAAGVWAVRMSRGGTHLGPVPDRTPAAGVELLQVSAPPSPRPERGAMSTEIHVLLPPGREGHLLVWMWARGTPHFQRHLGRPVTNGTAALRVPLRWNLIPRGTGDGLIHFHLEGPCGPGVEDSGQTVGYSIRMDPYEALVSASPTNPVVVDAGRPGHRWLFWAEGRAGASGRELQPPEQRSLGFSVEFVPGDPSRPSAAEAAAAPHRRFEAGLVSHLEVSQAERDLAEAEARGEPVAVAEAEELMAAARRMVVQGAPSGGASEPGR